VQRNLHLTLDGICCTKHINKTTFADSLTNAICFWISWCEFDSLKNLYKIMPFDEKNCGEGRIFFTATLPILLELTCIDFATLKFMSV
jgi:hypothetical protein